MYCVPNAIASLIPTKLRRPVNLSCPYCGARRGLKVSPSDNDIGFVWFCHACGERTGGGVRRENGTFPKPLAPKSDTLDPKWQRFFKAQQAITATDCAGRYLRKRCCPLPGPHCARYVPDLIYFKGRDAVGAYPSIIWLMTDAITGKAVNIQRTYLFDDGTKERKFLYNHQTTGAVIRLTPNDEVSSFLTIGEGPESSLSLLHPKLSLYYGPPVWSAVTAEGMATFPYLHGIESLKIVEDNDRAGTKAGRSCAERWEVYAEVERKRSPRRGEDPNDLLLREVSH